MVALSLTATERDVLVATLEVVLSRNVDDKSMEGQLFARTSKNILDVILRKLNASH